MRTWLVGLLLGAAFIAAPFSALAAEATFLGPIVPPECNCEGGDKVSSAADWGCVLQTFQNGINFVVTAGVFFLIIAIAYAGLMFILTPANPENRQKARKMLSNGVIGLLVVLSAWLVVDFVMKILYNPDTPINGKALGPWNEILKGGEDQLCLKVAENPPPLPGVIGGVPDGGPSTTGTDSGQGTCTVSENPGNPCSVQALSSTCFGDRPRDAAQICYKESAGGNPRVESGSDRLNSGTGPSYSIGLWQINLTVHKVAGLNCPAAFTAPCGSGYGTLIPGKPGACRSSVKDMNLYNQCVAAAKIPTNNYAAACPLYKSGGFQPWAYSANACDVPF